MDANADANITEKVSSMINIATALVRALVHQSPCGKINVIMMLGGEGVLHLVQDVLQLHCKQILALVVIMHSCG